MDVSLEYCSIGCNRTPHAVSLYQGTLAYAANNSIALAETLKSDDPILSVIGTLHGHSGRVNCVRWINNRGWGSFSREIVSGSVDSAVRVWRESQLNEFSCVQVLSAHSESVTSIAVTRVNEEVWLFSGSSDCSIIIWKRSTDKDQFVIHQTISLGKSFTFCLDCYSLPGTTSVVLVSGGDEGKVNCFVQQQDDKFQRVLCLLGHTDWIRDVDIIQYNDRDLLVASCSQDTYIRLWRITQDDNKTINNDDDSLLCLSGNTFSIANSSFTVTLEAVLCAHDDWVYSCRWAPPLVGVTDNNTPFCLLSASMDKTMIIWRPDPDSGLWLEHVRLGDVGGNTLGLFGAIFCPLKEVGGANLILAHGYHGAFHLWKKKGGVTEVELWEPLTSPGGHFGQVQDCCWEPKGCYLLSVSSDQSTRLHAPWKREESQAKWYELARPQIHGYDLQCVTPLSPLQFASGADEKVLRVFEAPQNFLENYSRISGISIKSETSSLPLGASVPALGLSNKAVFTKAPTTSSDSESLSTKNSFSSEVPVFSLVELTSPPIEEHLLQNTLWPETQKLYGHGYELYCVASNGRYIASACKASQTDHASIRIWDILSWKQVAVLTKHTLTVTQLRFSHSGDRLLAVSRDRLWSLWQFNHSDNEAGLVVNCVGVLDKNVRSHSRIIWSCSWTHDDKYFATASRDKKICVWGESNSEWRLVITPIELPQPVTAIDFAPLSFDIKYLLAIGMEDGNISLINVSIEKGEWSELMKVHPFLCHTSTVRCLQWQPGSSSNRDSLLLASCSNDHSVKILKVKV